MISILMQNFVLNRLSSQSSTFSYDAHVYYLPKLMQKSTSKNLLKILLIRSNFSPQQKAEIKNCFLAKMNWDIAYLTIFIIISNSQKFPGTKKISIYQLFRLPEDWKYLYCCEWNTVILTLIQPPLLLIPSLYPQLCWDPLYYVVIWNLTSIQKHFLIADMPKQRYE